jgi:hypothetical protein
MATINAKICVRRDTAQNFTNNNPILAVGEIAYETDTGKFKIGIGSSWNTTVYCDDVSISGPKTDGNYGLNYTFNSTINSIDGGHSNTISGGGYSTNENSISGETDYCTIGGGYDNLINGAIASTIAGGAHHSIALDGGSTSPSHGLICGGSYNEIRNGDNGTIGGGNANIISETNTSYATGQGATICGGYTNEASGKWATITGGQDNVVNQQYGSVSGGYGNEVNGPAVSVNPKTGSCIGGGSGNEISFASQSTIAGGYQNTIGSGSTGSSDLGSWSVISGGYQNTIADVSYAWWSSILGGRENSVNAEMGSVIGGYQNSVTGKYGIAFGHQASCTLENQIAQGGTAFSSAGDCQTSTVVIRCQTSDATGTVLKIGSSGSNLVIPNDTTWAFDCLISARRTDSNNESAGYKITGCIDNNSNTVALVGSPAVIVIAEDDSSWSVTVVANNTNKSLDITVQGAAGKSINWVGRLEISHVTG